MGLDPARDIIAFWPLVEVSLLKEAGVTAALLPWPASAEPCRTAGIAALAYLGESYDQAPQALAAGFGGLAIDARDRGSVRAFVGAHRGAELLVFLKPDQIAWDVAPAHPVLRAGQWPGIRSGPNVGGRDADIASASRDPWVDSNAYMVAWLRAMFPGRAAVLGYRADAEAGLTPDRMVPYGTLEVALAEAFAAGGNYVLSLDARYLKALAEDQPGARAAWRSLGRAASFLRERADLFRRPTRSRIAAVAGTLDQSGEVLNLMFRQNLFPEVIPADRIPALDPGRFRAVVHPDLPAPAGAAREHLLDYARGGGLHKIAPGKPWWPTAPKTRSDIDRDWYSLGKGRLIAYREPVSDPSEFALDVIDAVGVRTRDLRVLNASTVLGLVTGDPAALVLVNYGSERDEEFLVRMEGRFGATKMHEPDRSARALKTAKRGAGTEITIDRLGRVGVIVLE